MRPPLSSRMKRRRRSTLAEIRWRAQVGVEVCSRPAFARVENFYALLACRFSRALAASSWKLWRVAFRAENCLRRAALRRSSPKKKRVVCTRRLATIDEKHRYSRNLSGEFARACLQYVLPLTWQASHSLAVRRPPNSAKNAPSKFGDLEGDRRRRCDVNACF